MKKLFFLKLVLISTLNIGVFLVSSQLKAQVTIVQDEYLATDIMQPSEGDRSYYSKWTNGPTTSNDFFPIGVWYQNIKNAYRYSRLGVNNFLYGNEGLDLTPLMTYNMTFIPTTESISYLNPPAPYASCISSWIYQDEPDLVPNGMTTPIPTATVISDYNAAIQKDPTRPIFLNVSYCVSLDFCGGRANRSGNPGDYYEYAKGADCLSFDIYPMNTLPIPNATGWEKTYMDIVSEKISSIGVATDRLRKYGNYKKPVTAILEATNQTNDPTCKFSAEYIKPEAWIAIIHGAKGIVYFCHSVLGEAALLGDYKMMQAITTNNALIAANASIINSGTVDNATKVVSGTADITISQMTKRQNGYTYIYAIAEQPGSAEATFTLRSFTGSIPVEVVGENRILLANNGVFTDTFTDYALHNYKVATPGKLQSALNPPSINSNDFKIYKESDSEYLQYECIDPIQKLEVYNLSGSRIQSISNVDMQGSVKINNQYKGTVLIIKASTKNNIYVRKYIVI